jgi:hypothetical protein
MAGQNTFSFASLYTSGKLGESVNVALPLGNLDKLRNALPEELRAELDVALDRAFANADRAGKSFTDPRAAKRARKSAAPRATAPTAPVARTTVKRDTRTKAQREADKARMAHARSFRGVATQQADEVGTIRVKTSKGVTVLPPVKGESSRPTPRTRGRRAAVR